MGLFEAQESSIKRFPILSNQFDSRKISLISVFYKNGHKKES
jgi:hypothetical protein